MDLVRDIKNRLRGKPGQCIDVHHHVIPPFYVSALAELGITGATSAPFPRWSVGEELEVMEKHSITSAIVSISTPGTYFGDAALARDLTRRCNEYAASLVQDHPGRFGALAFLPLPDVEGALRELTYALDELELDGVALLTNVEGHYLGDPEYEELFAEFDRRRQVVFVHPHDPYGCPERFRHLNPITEWCFDTTRTVVNMMDNGVLKRYPNIRFILSHAGGTIPFLAVRIAGGRDVLRADVNRLQLLRHVVKRLGQLKRLYYDTTSAATPYALRSLQELADSSHILFGSDYTWAPSYAVALLVQSLRRYDGFDRPTLEAVVYKNAQKLFPRFRS